MVIDNADDMQPFFELQRGQNANLPDNAIEAEVSIGLYMAECARGSILITSSNTPLLPRSCL